MITKPLLIHQGWSHTNGEDMYDNVSIGSTKEAQRGGKLDQKPMKMKENSENGIIGSSDNGKMTDTDDEQGWTKIKTNGSRKPKMKNNEQPIIDSIITTIDIKTKKVKNGTMEVKIESPVRSNRCNIPDTTERDADDKSADITKQLMNQEPPAEEEEEEEEEENEDEDKEEEEDEVKKIEPPTRTTRSTITDGIEFELNSRNQNEQRLTPPRIEDKEEEKKQEEDKEDNEEDKEERYLSLIHI